MSGLRAGGVGWRVDVEHGGGFLLGFRGDGGGGFGSWGVFGRRRLEGVALGRAGVLPSDLRCDRAQAAQVKKWVRESLDYQ
jgi:hypothetical protein